MTGFLELERSLRKLAIDLCATHGGERWWRPAEGQRGDDWRRYRYWRV